MRNRPTLPPDVPPAISRFETVTGIYQASLRRGGFVVPDSASIPDIRIPPMAAGSALHGDHVQVSISKARPGHSPKGQITRVLKHANHKILGRITHAGRYSVVHPKNPRINRTIEIHGRLDPAEVPDGCWVIVEIRQWSSGPMEPLVGRLDEVLGTDEEPGLPILLLIREGGITPDFPEDVEAEAERLREHAITKETLKGRRDLREARIFTIDPARAKDFDDAVGLVHRVHDGWRVGVHIADVAHYVAPAGAIDTEAYERATSIYPVDRVIPMLPEALSNQICSLRPGEDRLTMSAEFTVSPSGEVSGVELYASVIHSVRRFAYEEVQGLFDAADEAAPAR
jgi:ribonuclease R